jgi:hypothetical protein
MFLHYVDLHVSFVDNYNIVSIVSRFSSFIWIFRQIQIWTAGHSNLIPVVKGMKIVFFLKKASSCKHKQRNAFVLSFTEVSQLVFWMADADDGLWVVRLEQAGVELTEYIQAGPCLSKQKSALSTSEWAWASRSRRDQTRDKHLHTHTCAPPLLGNM